MVKADLTRDYYGDLEISPTADVVEIKKQFKKLALAYHPDRNPGRESEVTAKFQKIQSAHEVLTDAAERAKYDANRVRASYRPGQSSGVRGNPWSNVSAQYPTPPKPPMARNRAYQPPPSAGAERYKKNFQPPNQSAYQSAQEGPEARESTYKAWENLKHANRADPGINKTWNTPRPPPRGTPKPSREENNARTQAPPPKSSFEDFREANSPRPRSHSTHAPTRKGFMPTGMGDEPPAPTGAYFSQRKSANPPPPPPREPPPSGNPIPEKLRRHRDSAIPQMEERTSTPYSTHGGDKLNPFEGANINRSKSTRERNDGFGNNQVPRADSDSNLAGSKPQRAKSFAARSSPRRTSKPAFNTVNLDTSSSDDLPEINGSGSRFSGKRNGAPLNSQQEQSAPMGPETSKQSKISKFRQWMKENPGQEPPPDGFPPDGPPLRSDKPKNTNGEPTIFSFNVPQDAFNRTNSNGFASSSAENISTKFTPEDWDGKFEAGGEYFKPEQKAAGVTPRARAQSGARPRGRSPIKVKPVDPRVMQPQVDDELVTESPHGTRFSADEWKETFKPQTFAPPPPIIQPQFRKRPSLRTTMGGNAAVVDESSGSDEKPLFTGRKPNISPPNLSPEPMDVDTPPAANTVPQFANNQNLNAEPLKRPAAASASQSPTDTEALKVNFDDLQIRDLISSLNLPTPPPPPVVYERPNPEAYEDYVKRYEKYMSAWDLFEKKFILHEVSRQRQNEAWKEKRWVDERITEQYRLGLKQDLVVRNRWNESVEKHELVVREWVVMREKMKSRGTGNDAAAAATEAAGDSRRPRKKTH